MSPIPELTNEPEAPKRVDKFAEFGTPISVTGMRMPPNVMFQNGEGGLMVGAHFNTGFRVSGHVWEIRLYPSSLTILTLSPELCRADPTTGLATGKRDVSRDRFVAVFPSGALQELAS